MRREFAWPATSGLDGVELELGSSEDGFPLSQSQRLKTVMSLRDELGLVYPSIGVNAFCQHSATDPSGHPILREAIDRALDCAEALKVPLLQIPSFGASMIRDDTGLKQTVALFRFACEKAAGRSILIGSENVLRIDDLNRLVREVDAPNFRVYFDTANPHAMLGEHARPLLEAALPYLAEVHLKEARDDKEPALLGEGDTDFAGVF